MSFNGNIKKLFLFILLTSICTGCSSSVRFTSEEKEKSKDKREESRYPDNPPVRPVEKAPEEEEPIAEVNELPAEAKDTRFKPENSAGVLETTEGVASFYGKKFHGRKTANGEIYDMNLLTAAHETYPFNTLLKVTNLLNDKSVIVRVNDRKPEFYGRIIDISYAAAKELDILIKGITKVKVEVISWGDNKKAK